MRTDRLPVDVFTNGAGRNYRQAAVIDLDTVRAFFESQGYSVVEIQQPWRHVTGRLEKDGRTFFLKMASTPDIGLRTQNEVAWNEAIGQKIADASPAVPLIVPAIHSTGEHQGLFFYLSDFISGPIICAKDTPDEARLRQWIPFIATILEWLVSLPTMEFPRDKEMSIQQRKDDYLKKVRGWRENLPEHDIDDLLVMAETMPNTGLYGVNHCDFVPWHMFEADKAVVLIDGEHGSGIYPLFYDLAYFFHRVYTTANLPDVAMEYLDLVKKNLKPEQHLLFPRQFPAVLASRIIGGLWDAKNDQKDPAIHLRLLEWFRHTHETPPNE